MAKITEESRRIFNTKIASHKDEIDRIFENEKSLIASMDKNAPDNAYKKIRVTEELIHASTLYVLINNLSLALLETKNTDALNEGRKTLYKAIIYLEEIVTNLIDAPFDEYKDEVEQIANISLEKRYELVRKIGLAIRLIVDAYGENTKWKWSFVELEGRFSTVAKNIVNLKDVIRIYFDPRNPEYDTAVFYLRLIKKLLAQSADGYRDRYELSTRRIDDMRLAINYLKALRRLHIVLDEAVDAEEVKKKALVWKSKMEIDQKKGVSK